MKSIFIICNPLFTRNIACVMGSKPPVDHLVVSGLCRPSDNSMVFTPCTARKADTGKDHETIPRTNRHLP